MQEERLTRVSNALSVAWLLWSISAAVLIALRGFKRRSLTLPGAVAATVVGFIHMECGLKYGMVLIMFYLTSSKLTKVKADLKQKLHETHEAEGRGVGQVLSNSLGGCVFALLAAALHFDYPILSTCCQAAFLAHYACCCGDTWASEVGMLSKGSPRLIATFKTVPPGTNGGISFLGLASSAAAGLLMGLTYTSSAIIARHASNVFGAPSMDTDTLGLVGNKFIPDLTADITHHVAPFWLLLRTVPFPRDQAWTEISKLGTSAWQYATRMTRVTSGYTAWQPVDVALWVYWVLAAVVVAIAGSVIDSLLGATLQYSGFDEDGKVVVNRPGSRVKHISGLNVLSNSMVNFVSALICSVGTALFVYYGVM